MSSRFILGGRFYWERVSRGGVLVACGEFANGICDAAILDLFAAYFRAGTQRTAWYLGLIGDTGFSALAAADTMSSHTGWTENTQYTASNRPQWSPPAPVGGIIQNTTVVSFVMSAAATIMGAFVVSDNTKGGTAGILWAHGLFDQPQTMPNGETLKLIYKCQGQSGSP